MPDIYNSQALNRYTYVFNDPLTLVDRNGYWPDIGYLPSQQLQANRGLRGIGGNPQAWLGFGQMLLGGLGYLGVAAEDSSIVGITLNGATITFSTDMFVTGAENFWNGLHDKPFADSPLDTAMGSINNEAADDMFTALSIAADPEKLISELLKYLAAQGLGMAKKGISKTRGSGSGGGASGGAGGGGGGGLLLSGSGEDCMLFQAYIVNPDGSKTPLGKPWVQCVPE